MYRMDGRDADNVSSIHYTELHHAQDEEHTETVHSPSPPIPHLIYMYKCTLLFSSVSQLIHIFVCHYSSLVIKYIVPQPFDIKEMPLMK